MASDHDMCMVSDSINCHFINQTLIIVKIVAVEIYSVVMLTERIVIILILFVILRDSEEISNGTFTQGSSSGSNTVFKQVIGPCCAIENTCFHSLDSALHCLTNNTIINISNSHVTLSTKISLENLENVSIIAHKASTVNCKGIGAINMSSCNNVTINGISWENCGSSNGSSYPGIDFYKSSNLIIQNCTFRSSLGQSLVFSDPSESVFIKNCKFILNNKHTDHGAAIQCITKATFPTITRLVIDRCNFSFNGVAKSIVYIGGSGNGLLSYLQNSVFIGNKGASLYISQQRLHITGDVLFKNNNMVTSGGGIYSRSSVIVFENKSNVTFYNNSATSKGGAMFINDSKLYFGDYSVIKFIDNFAKSFGGALYSMKNSAVLFNGNTMVTFQSDKLANVAELYAFLKTPMYHLMKNHM